MAIYHCSVKVIGRSGGKSAVASAAYRSGEKIINEYDGFTHDFTKKTGIVHTEIMTPDNAPEWTKERSKLWNAVEASEKRKDAQLSREIEIALPKELSLEKQKELLGNYCNENFVSKGMIADVAIHDKGDGNPHAHIMLTLRPVDETGFLAKKDRSWNDKAVLESWRSGWEEHANMYLDRKQHISHKSCDDMDTYKLATKHLGPYAAALEKSGIPTEIGDYNRGIKSINAIMGKEISDYEDQSIALLKEELEWERHEKERLKRESMEKERLAEKRPDRPDRRTELTEEREKLNLRIRGRDETISLLKNEITQLERKIPYTAALEQKLDYAEKHHEAMAKLAEERKKLGFFDFDQRRELNKREKREKERWEKTQEYYAIPKNLERVREELRPIAARKEEFLGEIRELQRRIDIWEKEKSVLTVKKREVEAEIEKLKSPEEKEMDRMRAHVDNYCERYSYRNPDRENLLKIELWLKQHPEHEPNREAMYDSVVYSSEKTISPEKIAKEVESDIQRKRERSRGIER